MMVLSYHSIISYAEGRRCGVSERYTWSLETEAVDLACGSTASGRIPDQALSTSSRRTLV